MGGSGLAGSHASVLPQGLPTLGTFSQSRQTRSTRGLRSTVARELSLAPGTPAGPGDPDTAELVSLRSAESDLLGRARLADRFGLYRDGITFGGRRDYYRLLGYKERLLPQDYRARYKRGGIAERIIEAYPKATWSGGASIVEDPDPNNVTTFESTITSLFDRLAIWRKIIRVDTLTGLGRYGALLIGTTDSDLDKPLEKGALSGPEDIIYITALTEDRAQIQQSVTDTTDARFGLPEFYLCHLGIPSYSMVDDDIGLYGGTSHAVTKRVHWSRVIHVAEQCLFDDVFGKPRLRAVWNYLDDLLKVGGGGAEAAWQRADPGINVNIDKDLRATKEELGKLRESVEEYQHGGLSRFFATRGAEVKLLNSPVNQFGANQDAITRLICGVVGIPHRVLLGSERGEMASTQDRDNWSDRVAERRQEFGIPLIRQFIDRLQEYGALPEVDEYDVEWPDEEELNEQEKGALSLTVSQANNFSNTAGAGLIMTNDEIRDQVWSLPPLVTQAPTVDAAGNPIDPTAVSADDSTGVDDPNPAASFPATDRPDDAGDSTSGSGATPSGATGTTASLGTDQLRTVQPDLVVGDPKKTQPKVAAASAQVHMAPVLTSIRFAATGKVVPVASIRSAGVRRLIITKLSAQRKSRRMFGGRRAAPFAPGGGRDSSHPHDAHGNPKR